MKLLKLLYLFIGGIILFTGCNIINPPEPTPTYVHIDSFSFQQTPNTGTTSHKITSLWAYFEGKTLGVFPVPCTIPIITSKPGLLLVRPGITFDGISDIQTPYFQYRSDTMTLGVHPGQIMNYTPKTSYYSDSIMNIINIDFENGNPFGKVDGDTGLYTTNNPDYVFEGGYSGLIMLDSQSFSLNILQQSFTSGKTPFLELNYKSTIPFQVGLQTSTSTGQSVVLFIAGFNPKSSWNKVYVGLEDFILQYPNSTYSVVLKVLTENPTSGYVAIDNVKVISIK